MEGIYQKADIRRGTTKNVNDDIYIAISKKYKNEVIATGMKGYFQRCKRINGNGRLSLKFIPIHGEDPLWLTLTNCEDGFYFHTRDTVYSEDEEDLRDFETRLDGLIPLGKPTYEIGIKPKIMEMKYGESICVEGGFLVNNCILKNEETNECIASVKSKYNWFSSPESTNEIYYFEGDGLILVQHNGDTICSVLFYIRELDYNHKN